jgi:hypothetical protein
MPTTGLCTTCASIDFERLFFQTSEEYDSTPMRSLSDLRQSEKSPFCNITIAAIYQIPETDKDDFLLEEGDTFSVYWHSVPVGGIPALGIRKPNRLTLKRPLAHPFHAFEFGIYLCLLDDLYFEIVLSDPWIRRRHFVEQNLFPRTDCQLCSRLFSFTSLAGHLHEKPQVLRV